MAQDTIDAHLPSEGEPEVPTITDKVILRRLQGNLGRNALAACAQSCRNPDCSETVKEKMLAGKMVCGKVLKLVAPEYTDGE